MTTQGHIFLALTAIVTFIIVFALFSRSRKRELGYKELDAAGFIVGVILGVLSAVLALAVSIVFIICLSKLTDENYHTIYSNKINANVKFSSNDDVDFVGGQSIAKTSDSNVGVLTLSKDDSTVNRQIYNVEYLGDVEKDSIVEKIEYSNSTQETKLFGVSLLKIKDTGSLKIHLKTPESKIAKEKQDTQNRKELNSLLDKE